MSKKMPKRKLIRRKEMRFSGYGCNVCGWLRPYPKFISGGIETREDLKIAFLLDKCDENPPQKVGIEAPSAFVGALA
jgi:hypothetical protein